MAIATYTTLGGSVSVSADGFVPASQLNTAVAIVGSYDDANADGSVTEGEATTVQTSTEADNQFGGNSELARQAALSFGNGASEAACVPLPETQSTESYTAASEGQLSETPILDPRVTTAEVTVTDTSSATDLSVSYVDEDPSSANADTDEALVNPVTGDWATDSSSDYDITYTYGDYDAALTEAVSQSVRYVIVCAEADSVAATALTKVTEQAKNFRFLRAVMGSENGLQSGSINSYAPAQEDWRLVEVAPTRGEDDQGSQRTYGAVGGLMAGQPITVEGSITYDRVNGLVGLAQEYTPLQADDFTQVTAITDEYEIAEGVTTSATARIRDIYKGEIIDLVLERLQQRVKNYRGGSNAQTAQRRFRSRIKRGLKALSAPVAQPPLLATGDGGRPFAVSVDTGASDTEADVDVGIEVAPIAKQVNVGLSVGPLRFDGVEA
jgi:hypothetical protein